MELLRDIGEKGYPDDYLQARIQGRCALFFNDWDSLVLSPDIASHLSNSHYSGMTLTSGTGELDKRYLKEVAWVYYQMSKELRHAFKPFFVYVASRTLISCLRYVQGKGSRERIMNTLDHSLISDRIKNVFSTSELPEILRITGKSLPFNNNGPDGLSRAYLSEGMPGVEQMIMEQVFDYVINGQHHPLIKEFFTALIDAFNILTLYKHMKWTMKKHPSFISGGKITHLRLITTMRSQNLEELASILSRFTGIQREENELSHIRSIINRGLTKKLQKIKRERSTVALILYYLWRFSMEQKNLSLLITGKDLDRNLVMEEMVY